MNVFRSTKAHQRLDVFLREQVLELSGNKAKHLCQQGLVLVNGSSAKPGRLLNVDDEVVLLAEVAPRRSRPELVLRQGGAEKFVNKLYEDEEILVIEKPRAMHSTRHHENDDITAADCVVALAPECHAASPDAAEGGLVNRLDFYTSGILLAAKNSHIWDAMHELMRRGEIKKSYLGLLEGTLTKDKETVNRELVSCDGGKRMRIGTVEEGGQPASTTFTVVERLLKATLVRATASPARRHQLRAHSAHLDHPFVGDELYGATKKLSDINESRFSNLGAGFFLHAERVEMKHPATGEVCVFKSEWKL